MKSFPVPDPRQAGRLLEQLLERPAIVTPRRVDRPLVLYGAGKMGHLAAELLQKLDIPVAYAIDRSPPPDRLLDGRIPVYRPDEAPPQDRRTHLIAVCTVFSPYQPIRAALAQAGWLDVTPFYDIAEAYVDRVPMGNGWFLGALEAHEPAEIRQVLGTWDDDHSRAAHLQFLAWRLHREEWEFAAAPVTIDDRYFIEPVRRLLGGEEFFLDAGACHGTVTETFLAAVGETCRGIVALEPDPDNAAVLREKLSRTVRSEGRRVELLPCALGERAGVSSFHAGLELASRLGGAGTAAVRVCTLDEIDAPATFAKIHLEGGELDALRGGLNWLEKRRPILAITVYHNRDGIWKIPKLLMNSLPGYRFLLRDHAWCGTGVVLYGIPAQRDR